MPRRPAAHLAKAGANKRVQRRPAPYGRERQTDPMATSQLWSRCPVSLLADRRRCTCARCNSVSTGPPRGTRCGMSAQTGPGKAQHDGGQDLQLAGCESQTLTNAIHTRPITCCLPLLWNGASRGSWDFPDTTGAGPAVPTRYTLRVATSSVRPAKRASVQAARNPAESRGLQGDGGLQGVEIGRIWAIGLSMSCGCTRLGSRAWQRAGAPRG